VKAFEVDEKPTEDYGDIGGLDKQIEELVEAVVMPMNQKALFDAIGIRPPKGVLMYGPPGTGKTLLARACAAQTKACFLKLAATQLVQMFIGDGSKMVRDAFALAREKKPAIIFVSVWLKSWQKCGVWILTTQTNRCRLMSWTPSAPSALTAARLEIERCSARCWNC